MKKREAVNRRTGKHLNIARGVIVLLSVIVMTLAFASCDKEDGVGNNPNHTEHTHTYATEWSHDDTYHWHASICGHETEVSDKAEHIFGDWIIDKDATEEEAGAKHRNCTVCGYTENGEIEKLPHTHKFAETWTNDEIHHWHASICGHDVTQSIMPHSYDVTWKCTECGYQDTNLHGTEISTKTLQMNGLNLYLSVSNSTSTFSFIKEIEVADGATFGVFADLECSNEIRSKTGSLNIYGNNTFYILVENGKDIALYTATIRRRPIYTVSFNSNGGKSVSSQSVEEGYFATEPMTERKGYTFDKWDYDFSEPITQKTTITASWNVITYNVYYDLNVPSDSISQDVDNSMNVITYTVEDAITFKTPSRKGYRFTGWDKNIKKGTIGDVTVTASWEAIEYDIIYNFDDANSVSKATNNAQNPGKYTIEDVITFAEPTRKGYTFVDWDKHIVPGTIGTQTITANWEVINYSITYELNGWENSSNNVGTYTIENQAVTLYDAIKGESLFCGWYLDGEYKNYIATIDTSTAQNYIVYAYADDSATKGVSIEDGCVKGYSYTSTNVVIPSYYKGYTVTSIGNRAFYNCSSLTSVTIPDSVTSIGSSAFYNCPIETATIPAIACNYVSNSKLKTVEITSGESIGEGAFSYCGSLTSVTIPDSVTNIGNKAFYNCSSLTSVTIPDSVTNIGNKAFYNCSSLTSVTIPDSVTSIGSEAFYNCSSLTSVTIPDSVTSIGSSAFYNCPIETATIPAIACNYVSNSKLKTVEITSGESIGEGAFSYCGSLTSVTIPDSVTNIGNKAFYNCSSLTSVTIPDSVTSIGEWAFSYCNSLTSITYNGTKAQWNAISRASGWDSNVGNYTITCTDGTISR